MLLGNTTTRLSLALLALILVGGTGCKHETPPPPAPPARVEAPPDQLDETEVLETPEEAFGLAIPEGMRVTKRLYGNVVIVGTRPMHDVLDYLRDHVEATESDGIGTASFVTATVKKPRSDWRGSLRIDVSREGDTTRVELWGEEPPPLPANTGKVLPAWVQAGKPPPRAPRNL